MNADVSLTITPLLSLGANQAKTILLKAKQTEGNVLSIHLDKIRAKTDQTEIVYMIKALPFESHTTVILFSSPQARVNKNFPWSHLLDWLIIKSCLSMLCVVYLHTLG